MIISGQIGRATGRPTIGCKSVYRGLTFGLRELGEHGIHLVIKYVDHVIGIAAEVVTRLARLHRLPRRKGRSRGLTLRVKTCRVDDGLAARMDRLAEKKRRVANP